MVAYNFFPRFADAVSAGTKRQTIRKAGKRPPPKPGQNLELYTGLRTMEVCRLRKTTCISAEPITISCSMRLVRMAQATSGESGHWVHLAQEEIELLARDDGFQSADEFFAFFDEHHGGTLNGYLIKWEA